MQPLKKSMKYSQLSKSSISVITDIEEISSPRLKKSKKYAAFKELETSEFTARQEFLSSLDCFNMALHPSFGFMCSSHSLDDQTMPRNCTCRKVGGYCEFTLKWLKRSPDDAYILRQQFYPLLNKQKRSLADGHKQIDLDLTRTYPDVQSFRADQFQKSLRRVLITFNNNNLDYLQGMNLLAAIFLHHAPEELAYWLLRRFVMDGTMLDIFSKSK